MGTFPGKGWQRAVEKVRQRLLRAASALEAAGVPYAVVGGNAVAAWVSRVDEAAVRNTQDVDILIRRQDLPAVIAAMAKAGFVHRHAAGIDMLLDGPEAKARDAVHLVFAAEKVRPEYLLPAPDVDESESASLSRFESGAEGGLPSPFGRGAGGEGGEARFRLLVLGVARADEAYVFPAQGPDASPRSDWGGAPRRNMVPAISRRASRPAARVDRPSGRLSHWVFGVRQFIAALLLGRR